MKIKPKNIASLFKLATNPKIFFAAFEPAIS
jgi:hypothetical protein